MTSVADRVRRANRLHAPRLIRHPDVVGVGIGVRRAAGVVTREPCIKLLVRKKRPLNEIEPSRVLPRSLETPQGDAATDVEESGTFHVPPAERVFPLVPGLFLTTPEVRFRPAPGGVSVSHFNFPAGTLGAVVTDAAVPGLNYVLSCSHVLARAGLAQIGDAILQPAPLAGGVYPRDVIAALSRAVRLDFRADGSNLTDAAVAMIFPGSGEPRIFQIGPVAGIRDEAGVDVGESVRKFGSGSGLTTGTISVIEATVEVNYATLGFPNLTAVFAKQVLTTAMSAFGDSGSLLFDSENNAIGMLMGSSPTLTIYNGIQNIQTALSVVVSARVV